MLITTGNIIIKKISTTYKIKNNIIKKNDNSAKSFNVKLKTNKTTNNKRKNESVTTKNLMKIFIGVKTPS